MTLPSKEQFRQELGARLAELSDGAIRMASHQVARQALQDPRIVAAQHVLAYLPIRRHAEIDPSPLLHTLPSVIMIDYIEPSASAPMPQNHYDVIFLPIFGFDKYNYRLGHGRGWFDKLLAVHPSAYTVGLALSDSFVDYLPREAHDIPLNTILVADPLFKQ